MAPVGIQIREEPRPRGWGEGELGEDVEGNMDSNLIICPLCGGKGEGGAQCRGQMVVSFAGLGTRIRSRFEAGDNAGSLGHGELGTVLALRGFLVGEQT